MATILKRTYGSKDEVPADFITLYTDKDGKFVLNPEIEIEGLVPRAQMDTFRDGNVRLKQRVEAYGGTIQTDAKGNIVAFGGVEPEKISDLMSKEQQLADGALTKKSEVETRVEQRVGEEKRKWETQKAQLDTQLRDLREKHRSMVIDAKATELAMPFGLRKDPAAREGLALMVKNTWTTDDNGDPVAYEADGKTVKYDGDGVPMRGGESFKRYIESLAKDKARFFFEDNQGGGAGGDGGRGGSRYDDNEVNPFDPKTWNRTNQAKLVNKDFKKAQRMAAKFNVELKPGSLQGVDQASQAA